ncbi:SDR family oxidoreductase [Corallincola platygyrae]|uniref:SDR family oxidoreductase n=1 Tax=Corallincola platygyrae TaxID=1193278 RepID=A0ABW4XS56_9GAMM
MLETTNVLITGANRGIGLEFVKYYLAQGANVIACCRHPSEAHELVTIKREQPDKLAIQTLDVADPESIEQAAMKLANLSIDILINNAGVYGPKGYSFGDVEADVWQQVLQVNTIAPLLVSQAFLPHLKAGKLKVLACITSKMGSMADNGSGGSYIYRSSKAGLNAVVKSMAIDLAAHQIKVVALHPGWVKTQMGGSNALITTEQSVCGMTQVIDKLDNETSGLMINFDGTAIPW